MLAQDPAVPGGAGPDLHAVHRWVEKTCEAQDVPVAVCGEDTIRRLVALLGGTSGANQAARLP
jgi:hypothetical protein